MNTEPTQITATQYEYLRHLIDNNDRVLFYVTLYELTGNNTAWLMSQISSQSDIPGGVAWMLNEAYTDRVPGYPVEGVEYFSVRVARDDFDSIEPSGSGGYTVPSELQMLRNAHDTWDTVGGERGNPNLGDWFPGSMALVAYYTGEGDLQSVREVMSPSGLLAGALVLGGGIAEGLASRRWNSFG